MLIGLSGFLLGPLLLSALPSLCQVASPVGRAPTRQVALVGRVLGLPGLASLPIGLSAILSIQGFLLAVLLNIPLLLVLIVLLRLQSGLVRLVVLYLGPLHNPLIIGPPGLFLASKSNQCCCPCSLQATQEPNLDLVDSLEAQFFTEGLLYNPLKVLLPQALYQDRKSAVGLFSLLSKGLLDLLVVIGVLLLCRYILEGYYRIPTQELLGYNSPFLSRGLVNYLYNLLEASLRKASREAVPLDQYLLGNPLQNNLLQQALGLCLGYAQCSCSYYSLRASLQGLLGSPEGSSDFLCNYLPQARESGVPQAFEGLGLL